LWDANVDTGGFLSSLFAGIAYNPEKKLCNIIVQG